MAKAGKSNPGALRKHSSRGGRKTAKAPARRGRKRERVHAIEAEGQSHSKVRPALTGVAARDVGEKRPRQGARKTEHEDPDIAAWRDELAFFESVRADLLEDESYKRKCVAIRHHKIVDSDADNFRLARRIHRRHPGEVVLIVMVEDVERVVELPSPELVL